MNRDLIPLIINSLTSKAVERVPNEMGMTSKRISERGKYSRPLPLQYPVQSNSNQLRDEKYVFTFCGIESTTKLSFI